jgi:uncharacterized membrane protein
MFQKKSPPILLLFFAVNLFGFLVQKGWLHSNLKINFLLVVNGMLLFMYFFNMIRISKLDKANPNAMVRSVMVGTLLKMVVFIGMALVYTTQVKQPVGMATLLASMGIYLLYTWLEIKADVYKK